MERYERDLEREDFVEDPAQRTAVGKLDDLYRKLVAAEREEKRRSALGRALRRWRGIRPVLWDVGMVQEELQEALHCGLFGLEQDQDKGSDK